MADAVDVTLLSVILATELVLLREVYTLKAMFKDHLRYLHPQGVGKDA